MTVFNARPMVNRRDLLKIGGAAAALPLLGGRAFAQKEMVKAAFVLIGTPDDNGWNFGLNSDIGTLEDISTGAESRRRESLPRQDARQDPALAGISRRALPAMGLAAGHAGSSDVEPDLRCERLVLVEDV